MSIDTNCIEACGMYMGARGAFGGKESHFVQGKLFYIIIHAGPIIAIFQ